MSLTLYFDENVHGAIFKGLHRLGIDVRRVQDEGQSETPDLLILDRALANGWVVYTMDEDFLAEARKRQITGDPFCGVIYNHKLRLSVGQIIEDLFAIAECALPEEYVNRVEYLPLRK